MRIVFIAHALQAWALFCPQSPDALFNSLQRKILRWHTSFTLWHSALAFLGNWLCFVLLTLRVSFTPGQVHRAAAASTQPRADASWKETTHDGGAAGEKKVQLPAARCHKMLQKYTHTVQDPSRLGFRFSHWDDGGVWQCGWERLGLFQRLVSGAWLLSSCFKLLQAASTQWDPDAPWKSMTNYSWELNER